MNENIDILELLIKAPMGTKLYAKSIGECKLFNIVKTANTIQVLGLNNNTYAFDNFGRQDKNGECLLFPSKQQADWSKFKFITTFKENEPIMCYNDTDGWVLRPATGIGNGIHARRRDYSFIERIRVSEFDFENYCNKKYN